MKNKLKPILLTTGILLSTAVLVLIFSISPSLVLKYYSTGIYPYISSTLRFISSIFPFALGDVIYIVLIGFALYKVIIFIKKFKQKQFNKTHRITIPLQVINFLFVLYLIFKIVWGLNYSRPSIGTELKIDNKKYSVKELVALGNYFVDKTNALKEKQSAAPKYSLSDLKEKSIEAYKMMAQGNTIFSYPNPSFKATTSAYAISKMGIEGYYAPLSGEANINMNLPDFIKPYVSCHEIAHQLGIAYEDEANLLGYLTANNSSDINFKYAANYEMLRYILFEIALKSPDDYKLLKAKIADKILADFKIEKEFWRQYNGEMFKYMDSTFDRFLKLNNQKKGINSYQDIVIWLWNLHKSEAGSQISEDMNTKNF